MDLNKLDKSEISKLDDNTLIKEIEKTNEDQLVQIGLMAYTEVFNRGLYLRTILDENKELIDSLVKEEPKFKEIYDIFNNKFIDLDIVRFIDKEDFTDTEELIELRRKVSMMLSTLNAYATEISYANEIAKDRIYLNFIAENIDEIEDNMDLNRLVENIQMFLSEDARTVKNKVADITSVIPIRISRYKYYDMIESAFEKTLREASKEMIDIIISRYKVLFDGRLEKEYGFYFDKYFMKAEEANRVDFKEITDKDLNKVYEESSKTIMEINSVINIVREYGVVLNRLIAISLLKDKIILGMEKNGEIKTLLTDWNNYLSNPKANRANVMKSYSEAFEELDKKFKDNNFILQELSMENFHRGNKVEDDLKASLERAQYILSYINDYSLEREEIKELTYYEPAGEAYLKEAVKSLVEYMDRNSTDMSNIQKKARMKRTISLVEGVFQTPQSFFEYLVNSLNQSRNSEEKIALANNILEIINRYRGNTVQNIKH